MGEAHADAFDSWAIVELMGRARTAGRVTEEQRFGATLGRVDVPNEDGTWVTTYFGGASVYRLTPCSEEAARAVARHNKTQPVHQWELPQPKLPAPDVMGEHVARAQRLSEEMRERGDRYDYLGVPIGEDLDDDDRD